MKFQQITGYKLVFLVVALIILWYVKLLVFLLFGSLMIGILGSGASDYISKKFKIKYIYGVLIFFIVVLILFVSVIIVTLPLLFDQSTELINQFPQHLNDTENKVNQIFGIEVGAMQELQNFDKLSFITNYLKNILNLVSSLFLMLVIGIYFIVDNNTYKNMIYNFFTKKKATSLIEGVSKDIRLWFLGQFISMFIVGVFITISLLILGVPFAFVLGFFAGLMEFVPTLGPIIAFIPILMVSFSKSTTLALYVTILYLVVQLLESNVLTPLIQQKLVSVPAAIQLSVQILFGLLFGFVGVFLAVPFFVFLRAIYRSIKD